MLFNYIAFLVFCTFVSDCRLLDDEPFVCRRLLDTSVNDERDVRSPLGSRFASPSASVKSYGVGDYDNDDESVLEESIEVVDVDLDEADEAFLEQMLDAGRDSR
jgi:hypothetical protein